MKLRLATFIAAGGLFASAGPAAAQFQPAPPQGQFQQAPQTQQAPPCLEQFGKLRDDARKKADRIGAASSNNRKPTAQEACQLFRTFSAAEAKLIKYADENSVWCGIPKNVVDSMKEAHLKTSQIRAQVCKAAAAPARPRGPSLSDALSAPVPNANNIQTGRGTFDTLTGTPLGR